MTALARVAIDAGVDTLVVAGCTTSGCVRATVVDSFSYGFRLTHAVNLFDMDQKYANVLSAEEPDAGLART